MPKLDYISAIVGWAKEVRRAQQAMHQLSTLIRSFAYMDNGMDPLHFQTGLIWAKMDLTTTIY